MMPFILLYIIFFKPSSFTTSYNIKKTYRLKKNKFKNKILKNKTSGRRKQQRKWPQIYKKIRLLKRIRLSIKKKNTKAEIYKSYYRNRIKMRLFINKVFKHTLNAKILIKENYIKKNIQIKQLNLFLSFLLVRLLVIPTLYIAFFLIKKHYVIINGLIIKNPYYIVNIACLNIITISYFSQRILFMSRQYKRLAQYRLQEKYIFKVKRRKWNPKRYLKYIRWRRFDQLFRYPNSKGTAIPLIHNKKYTKIQILQAVNRTTYRKVFYNNFLQYNCYINYYRGYHRIRRRYKKLYSSIISRRPYLKFIRLAGNNFIKKFPYDENKTYFFKKAEYYPDWAQRAKKRFKNKTTDDLIEWYIKNVLSKKKVDKFTTRYLLSRQNNNLNKKISQKFKNEIIKKIFCNIIKYINRAKKITFQIRLIKKLFYSLYKHWNRIKIEIIHLDRLKKKISIRKFRFNVILINYYQVKLYTPHLNNKYYLNAYFIINMALKKINLFRKQNRKFRYIARFVYHSRYYKPQRDYNKKFRSRFYNNRNRSNNVNMVLKKNSNVSLVTDKLLKKSLDYDLSIRKNKKIINKPFNIKGKSTNAVVLKKNSNVSLVTDKLLKKSLDYDLSIRKNKKIINKPFNIKGKSTNAVVLKKNSNVSLVTDKLLKKFNKTKYK
jgi:hypothetical protein